MHIEIIDDLNMIIHLNNIYTKTVNLNSKEEIKNWLQKLFSTLKNHYDINMNGFYNINVFQDKYYGIILEIEKEDIDYLDYFDGQVDMNIVLENNSTFLYEINDFFNIDKSIINKIKIYKYKQKIYIQIIDSISSINIGKLIEFSKIVYNGLSKQILKHGKEIEIKPFLNI